MNACPVLGIGRIRLRFFLQTLVAFAGVGLLVKYTYNVGIERLKEAVPTPASSENKLLSALKELPISSSALKEEASSNQDEFLPIFDVQINDTETEVQYTLQELETNSDAIYDVETAHSTLRTMNETRHNTERPSTIATEVRYSLQELETTSDASPDVETAHSTLSRPTLKENSHNTEKVRTVATEVRYSVQELETTSDASPDVETAYSTLSTLKETSHNKETLSKLTETELQKTTSISEALQTTVPSASFVTGNQTVSLISCGHVPPEGLKQVIYSEELESVFKRILPSWQSWDKIKPATTSEERDTIRLLLHEFIKVCDLYNITNYFIFSGTLLGSYRHHGLQPWDDDFDILMQYSDKLKIREVFGKYANQSQHLVVEFLNERMKLFHRTRSIPIAGFQHRWPFLDISFYYENETHIWELYVSTNTKYHVTPKTLIFPLHLRPFESVMINSPRDAFAVLKSLFSNDQCVSLTWIHKEEIAPPSATISFDCEKVAPIYPFVHRRVAGSCVEETLWLNDTALYTVLIEEPTYAIPTPFRLRL